MGAKRKSYTPKYRAEAARLVIDTGRTIVEVVREIGVGEALLGRWVAIERSPLPRCERLEFKMIRTRPVLRAEVASWEI